MQVIELPWREIHEVLPNLSAGITRHRKGRCSAVSISVDWRNTYTRSTLLQVPLESLGHCISDRQPYLTAPILGIHTHEVSHGMKHVNTSSTPAIIQNRPLLSLLGWFCIGLAVIGAILPVMPTTVFVLCAAWCFARSNQRFYQWLLNHRVFGDCVKGWQEGRAIPRRAYRKIMLLLWAGMGVSILLVDKPAVTFLLLFIGLCVSGYLFYKSEYWSKKI